MTPGSYDWARAEHASGRTVSCGLGTRSWHHPWNRSLDRPAERASTGWVHVVRSIPTAVYCDQPCCAGRVVELP